MKNGVSLILLIIMFLVIIILSGMCVFVINNDSSFFNIKECKYVKNQIQEKIYSIIYECELYMSNDLYITEGYIEENAEKLPVISSYNYSHTLNYEDILGDYSLEGKRVYLDKNGIVHIKYLFLDI